MKVAAIVLAAGTGKRVGGPKALLRTNDGERFVERIVRVARDAGLLPIVVVAEGRDDVAAAVPEGTSIVRNAQPERGPIESLRLGVAAAGDVEAVLAWPVDHPLVTSETLRRIVESAENSPGLAIVPVHRGRGGHPTLFPRTMFDALAAIPDGEGARGVLRANEDRVRRIDVDDPAVVRDVDTPGDLAAMRSGLVARPFDGSSDADRRGLLALFDACGCSCFCRYWHFGGDKNEWLARTAFEPETSARELADAAISRSDEARGVVAVADGRVVGWSKVAPARSLRKLYEQRYYRGLPMLGADRDGVFAIGCVLVDPAWRKKSVAAALASAAVDAARSGGATALEAFPRVPSEPVSDEEMWMGVESAFERAGFRRVVDAAPYPVLRVDFVRR